MSALSLRLLQARNQTRGLVNSLRLTGFYLREILEHSTPRKALNAAAAKAFKHLRRDRLWSLPYRYTIDPLNVCNLRCPLCPTGLGTLGRERGKMALEQFKFIVDQIVPYAYILEMYNWGEPFLHPQIFDMIEYATQRRIMVRLSSNLNHFSREMAEKTVASGLDGIIVSVDGATEETYQKYRRKGNLARVLDNIRLLVEAKQQARSRSPYIVFRTLVTRYNESEIDELRRIAAELRVDGFTTGTIFVNTGDKEQIKEWLPTDERLSYYDYSAERLENVWHCADLWESVTINWDGGMAPCCWLHDKANDFDNIFSRPLQDIWNGDAYISSRRVFAFGGPKDGPQKTICTVCKGKPQYLKF